MSLKKFTQGLLLATLAGTSTAYADKTSIERGEYLATLLGCEQCHTEGALVENWPYGAAFAGSRIGIAYTDYDRDNPPGIVFPKNLTSHKKTGIGRWKKKDIMRMIKTGRNHIGEQALPVMPWPNYSLLNNKDSSDIADYLMSLPPVDYEIPANITPGDMASEPYVRFGVYVFDPEAEPSFLKKYELENATE